MLRRDTGRQAQRHQRHDGGFIALPHQTAGVDRHRAGATVRRGTVTIPRNRERAALDGYGGINRLPGSDIEVVRLPVIGTKCLCGIDGNLGIEMVQRSEAGMPGGGKPRLILTGIGGTTIEENKVIIG